MFIDEEIKIWSRHWHLKGGRVGRKVLDRALSFWEAGLKPWLAGEAALSGSSEL